MPNLRSSLDPILGGPISAIILLLQSEFHLSAAILIYSTIDTLAWLDRPSGKTSVSRSDFVSWVDSYLLTDPPANYDAMDLYGARCGLLHSQQAGSDLSKDGRAREVWYCWGDLQPETMQSVINAEGHTDVAVHLGDLFERLTSGMLRFISELEGQPDRAQAVARRAEAFFRTASSTAFRKAARQSREETSA